MTTYNITDNGEHIGTIQAERGLFEPEPDTIEWQGQELYKRNDGAYSCGSVWAIDDEEDALTRQAIKSIIEGYVPEGFGECEPMELGSKNGAPESCTFKDCHGNEWSIDLEELDGPFCALDFDTILDDMGSTALDLVKVAFTPNPCDTYEPTADDVREPFSFDHARDFCAQFLEGHGDAARICAEKALEALDYADEIRPAANAAWETLADNAHELMEELADHEGRAWAYASAASAASDEHEKARTEAAGLRVQLDDLRKLHANELEEARRDLETMREAAEAERRNHERMCNLYAQLGDKMAQLIDERDRLAAELERVKQAASVPPALVHAFAEISKAFNDADQTARVKELEEELELAEEERDQAREKLDNLDEARGHLSEILSHLGDVLYYANDAQNEAEELEYLLED